MITNPTPLPYSPTQVSTMQQYPTPATLTPGASAIYSQLQAGQPQTMPAQQPGGQPVMAPPQGGPAPSPQQSLSTMRATFAPPSPGGAMDAAQGQLNSQFGTPHTNAIANPMLNQAQQALSTAISQQPGRVIYPGNRQGGIGVPRPGPSVRGLPGRVAPAPLMVA